MKNSGAAMADKQKMYKVLIVDDSIVFRKMLESVFSHFDSFQIVGSVWNGTKIKSLLESGNYPDLITLDVEMPEMDGIATLKMIQEFNAKLDADHKMQVLMVSSKTRVGADVTIQALNLGAFDFITKPDGPDALVNRQLLHENIKSKLDFFTEKKISAPAIKGQDIDALAQKRSAGEKFHVLVIGISTGGPKTLSQLLPELSKKIDIPVIVAQHMPAGFTLSLAQHLNLKCAHNVVEAEDGLFIAPKTIYLAPGDKNLVIRKNTQNLPICSLNNNPVENGCFPSVDILFRSAANIYAHQCMALIMTGMGHDGTAGSGTIKRQGGMVIAQGEKTSVVWGMPARAIEAGYVDHVLEVDELPEFIAQQME